MRKVAVAVVSPVGIVLLCVLLFGLYQWYDYYSPESRCRRDARREFFGDNFLSRSESANRFAQQRINEIIEKETRKCLENRENN